MLELMQTSEQVYSSYFGHLPYSSAFEHTEKAEAHRSNQSAYRKHQVHSLNGNIVSEGVDDYRSNKTDLAKANGNKGEMGGKLTKSKLENCDSTGNIKDHKNNDIFPHSDSERCSTVNQDYVPHCCSKKSMEGISSRTVKPGGHSSESKTGTEAQQMNTGPYHGVTDSSLCGDVKEQSQQNDYFGCNFEHATEDSKIFKDNSDATKSPARRKVSTNTVNKTKEQLIDLLKFADNVHKEWRTDKYTSHEAAGAVSELDIEVNWFHQLLHSVFISNGSDILELRGPDHQVNEGDKSVEIRPSDDRKTYLKITDQHNEVGDVLQFVEALRGNCFSNTKGGPA